MTPAQNFFQIDGTDWAGLCVQSSSWSESARSTRAAESSHKNGVHDVGKREE